MRLLLLLAAATITHAYTPIITPPLSDYVGPYWERVPVERSMQVLLGASCLHDCATLQLVHKKGLIDDSLYDEMLCNNGRNTHPLGSRRQAQHMKYARMRALRGWSDAMRNRYR